MSCVYKYLRCHSTLWDDFGRELDVSRDFRQELKMDQTARSSSKLESVLYKWIEGRTCDVSWQTILDVLQILELNATAQDIRDKLNIK